MWVEQKLSGKLKKEAIAKAILSDIEGLIEAFQRYLKTPT